MTRDAASLRLADHTTLRLGGPARRLVRAETDTELIEAVLATDDAEEPLLVLGGGSNLVVPDAGFDGVVVQVATVACGGRMSSSPLRPERSGPTPSPPSSPTATTGVEALSGIPGLVGATPIQNVGAYGQEVAQTVGLGARARPRTRDVEQVPASDCRFHLPAQRLQVVDDRRVVLAVEFSAGRGGAASRCATRPSPAPRRRGRRRRARGRGPRGGARPPPREGHGARPRRSRHLERGSFFTNPIIGADDAARCRPPRPAGRSPRAG